MRYLFTLVAILISPLAVALTVTSTTGKFNVTTESVVRIAGTFNDEMYQRFHLDMLATKHNGTRLILISSPGGSAAAGNKMIAIIEAEKKQGIVFTCVVIDEASSMAFNLLTHCNVRLALPTAELLFHRVEEASVDAFRITEKKRLTGPNLRKFAEDLDKWDAAFSRDNSAALHMDLDTYHKLADQDLDWKPQDLVTKKYLQDTATIKP